MDIESSSTTVPHGLSLRNDVLNCISDVELLSFRLLGRRLMDFFHVLSVKHRSAWRLMVALSPLRFFGDTSFFIDPLCKLSLYPPTHLIRNSGQSVPRGSAWFLRVLKPPGTSLNISSSICTDNMNCITSLAKSAVPSGQDVRDDSQLFPICSSALVNIPAQYRAILVVTAHTNEYKAT